MKNDSKLSLGTANSKSIKPFSSEASKGKKQSSSYLKKFCTAQKSDDKESSAGEETPQSKTMSNVSSKSDLMKLLLE